MGDSSTVGGAVGVDGVTRVTYATDAVASTLPVATALAVVFVGLEVAHPLVFGESAGTATTVLTGLCAVFAAVVALLWANLHKFSFHTCPDCLQLGCCEVR